MVTKYPPRLFSNNVGCGRWWNVPHRNSYNSFWDVYINKVLQNKKVVMQHVMKPDFINILNQENESPWTFMPPCPLFHRILEILSLYSIYPYVLSESKHFAIKKWPKVKTNTQRSQGGAIKMVPEMFTWCWKVKKWCCFILKQDVENSAQNI